VDNESGTNSSGRIVAGRCQHGTHRAGSTRPVCNGCSACCATVSSRHGRATPATKILQFPNVPRGSRSSPQVDSAATASDDKCYLDLTPPDLGQPLTQTAVNEAKETPGSEQARNIATVYKQATLAAGLGNRLLPDGTMTIAQVNPPDFADLDRCVQELSDLGVGPVGLTPSDADETLQDPAPSELARINP